MVETLWSSLRAKSFLKCYNILYSFQIYNSEIPISLSTTKVSRSNIFVIRTGFFFITIYSFIIIIILHIIVQNNKTILITTYLLPNNPASDYNYSYLDQIFKNQSIDFIFFLNL